MATMIFDGPPCQALRVNVYDPDSLAAVEGPTSATESWLGTGVYSVAIAATGVYRWIAINAAGIRVCKGFVNVTGSGVTCTSLHFDPRSQLDINTVVPTASSISAQISTDLSLLQNGWNSASHALSQYIAGEFSSSTGSWSNVYTVIANLTSAKISSDIYTQSNNWNLADLAKGTTLNVIIGLCA